jgi:hypothetical protein
MRREVEGFVSIPVRLAGKEEGLRPGQIMIDRGRRLNDAAPGVVIFTSGTTGELCRAF